MYVSLCVYMIMHMLVVAQNEKEGFGYSGG